MLRFLVLIVSFLTRLIPLLALPSTSVFRRRFGSAQLVETVVGSTTMVLSEPILSPSLNDEEIQFDTAGVANPVILPPSEDNPKWQCYYYGNAGSWFGDIATFIPTGWCGLAESDDGIHWTKVAGQLEGGSILAPSGNNDWDGIQIGVGDVVRVRPGELHMYYFGGSNEELQMGPTATKTIGFRMRIGRAKSLDGGRTWEKMGMCLDYDENEGLFASWPRIVVPDDENEPWRMIYHSFTGTKWRVFGAASTDKGDTWTRTGLILEGGEDEESFDYRGIGTRDVTPWKGGLLMIYEAVDKKGIHRFGGAFCEHKNGNGKWEKLETGKSILEPGKEPFGEWTNMVIGTPYLVPMPDGSLRLYHCAKRDSEQGMGIGVLVSDTGEIAPEAWRAVESMVEA